jgi:predicted PurR-regulated permease PerM
LNPNQNIPFYAKLALIFVGAFAFIYTLHVGQQIILPVVYAVIIAILLNPLVNYLIEKGIPKIISISIALTFTIAALAGIFYVLTMQLSIFSETFPLLKAKFDVQSQELVQWISDTFNIRQSAIRAWTIETRADALGDLAIGEHLMEAGQFVLTVVLLPVYVFMVLYYKVLLLEFIRRLFGSDDQVVVTKVLAGTRKIIQTYLAGLFLEMLIVAVLNSVGLLILGIDYAIILGITGALFNIIPYIGGIIAIALPMTVAYVTTDSLTSPFLVLSVYMFIQFIDNHYVIPRIVASRVRINALVSVIVVLIGGMLWGVPGMFLSIPLTAIVKVICDHIEPLKPWGFLLGNIIPNGVPSKRSDHPDTEPSLVNQ